MADSSVDNNKSRKVAIILTYFGGVIGAQKFYLGQIKKGGIYLVIFWTGIPLILSIVEGFRYLRMSDEEFHHQLEMDEDEFEQWKKEQDKSREVAKEKEKKQLQREAEGYTADSADDSVTMERLEPVTEYLDDDEEVHYLLKGSGIDVSGAGTDNERFSFTANARTAITNKRILTVVPKKITGTDTRTILYESTAGVDLDKGPVNKYVNIEANTRTYRINFTPEDEDTIRDAIRFIRDKQSEVRGRDTSGSEEDPLSQLSELEELQESGTITEEEFEEKKQELLNRL